MTLVPLLLVLGCSGEGESSHDVPSNAGGADGTGASGGSASHETGGATGTGATGSGGVATGGQGSGGAPSEPDPCPGVSDDPLENVPAAAAGSTTFRILYVIKPNVDAPGYDYTMTDQQIDAARRAYGSTFPQMVQDHTEGSIVVDATVIVMPRLVTSNAVTRGVSDRPGVWPPDMPQEDLKEYFGSFARGFYDQVQNYNAIPQFQYVNSGWFETDASVSWSVLNRRDDLGYDQDALAGSWHEWLHGWETYYFHYSEFPDTAPSSCVHCAGDHGYTQNSGGAPFWIGWYRDIATGADGLGFGKAAIDAHGTPRSRFEEVAPAVDDDTVRIEVRSSSRLMTATEAGAVQGGYGTGALPTERFSVEKDGEGRLRLTDEAGRALVANGDAVSLLASATDERDLWQPVYTGFGHYALFNACTGEALSVAPDALAAGAPLGTSEYVGGPSQQFRLIALDE